MLEFDKKSPHQVNLLSFNGAPEHWRSAFWVFIQGFTLSYNSKKSRNFKVFFTNSIKYIGILEIRINYYEIDRKKFKKCSGFSAHFAVLYMRMADKKIVRKVF